MTWKRIGIVAAILVAMGAAGALLVPLFWLISVLPGAGADTSALESSPRPPAPATQPGAITRVAVTGAAPQPPPRPTGFAPSVDGSEGAFSTSHMRQGVKAAIARQLSIELASLRRRLDECPDQPATQLKAVALVQRQLAAISSGDSARADAEAAQGVSEISPVFMLDVETFDSQVKILDAVLATPGSTSASFAACAQRALRGQILLVPAATPGDRLRVPLDLTAAGTGAQPIRHTSRRHR